jgi:antibiotic biosynthesis monooxygenase (ABM) superfamily enzyme
MKFKFKIIAALKTWVAIYPSITLFLFLFGNHLSSFPLYQRTLILTIALVPWLIFVGMPAVNFFIGLFSFKKTTNHDRQKTF